MEWVLLGVLTYFAWILHERNRALAANVEKLMHERDKMQGEVDDLTAIVLALQSKVADLAARGTIPPSRNIPLSK